MNCEGYDCGVCTRDANCPAVQDAARLIGAATQLGNLLTLAEVFAATGLDIRTWTGWAKEAVERVLEGEIAYENRSRADRYAKFLTVLPRE